MNFFLQTMAARNIKNINILPGASTIYTILDRLGRTRSGHHPRRHAGCPGTTDDRRTGGFRGQDVGGQDGRRAEARPGPGGAGQDQPVGAGPGQEAAADHRRRVRASQHGPGRGHQATEPGRRRRVHESQRVRRRNRQTGTVSPPPSKCNI